MSRRSSNGCSATAASFGLTLRLTPSSLRRKALRRPFLIGADFIGGDPVCP